SSRATKLTASEVTSGEETIPVAYPSMCPSEKHSPVIICSAGSSGLGTVLHFEVWTSNTAKNAVGDPDNSSSRYRWPTWPTNPIDDTGLTTSCGGSTTVHEPSTNLTTTVR